MMTLLHGKTERDDARRAFAFEGPHSFSPSRERTFNHVCLVDDASGGTDHTDWFARVSNALTTPGREEGRVYLLEVLAAETHRGIRVCTIARGARPRAAHPRAEPRVHTRYGSPRYKDIITLDSI